MSKGGSPKVKETLAEKQQAQQAVDRWNERKNDGYIALEQAQAAESGRDNTALFAGRTAADVAHAEKTAYGTAGHDSASYGRVANTLGGALATGATDAATAGLKYSDARKVSAIKMGNNIAGDVSTNLDSMASRASRRATEKVNNDVMINNAKFNAGMQVVGAGIQGNAMKNAGYSVDGSGVRAPTNIKYASDDPSSEDFNKEVSRSGGQSLGYGSFLSQLGR